MRNAIGLLKVDFLC